MRVEGRQALVLVEEAEITDGQIHGIVCHSRQGGFSTPRKESSVTLREVQGESGSRLSPTLSALMETPLAGLTRGALRGKGPVPKPSSLCSEYVLPLLLWCRPEPVDHMFHGPLLTGFAHSYFSQWMKPLTPSMFDDLVLTAAQPTNLGRTHMFSKVKTWLSIS